MNKPYRTLLGLFTLLTLASVPTGCTNENADAHFRRERVLIEVGSTYNLRLLDVTDPSRLTVRSDDATHARLITESDLFFDVKHVVRVERATAGSTTIELYDGDTQIDTITVDAAAVARFEIVADDALYGTHVDGAYSVLADEEVILRLVAYDAQDRPFDGTSTRSIVADDALDAVFGWDETYLIRAASGGTHTFSLETDAGITHGASLAIVDAPDVRALRATAFTKNEMDCISIIGLTDDASPVLGLEPTIMVNGATSDLDVAFGTVCFEETPAAGTVLAAMWNGLGVTHTF